MIMIYMPMMPLFRNTLQPAQKQLQVFERFPQTSQTVPCPSLAGVMQLPRAQNLVSDSAFVA